MNYSFIKLHDYINAVEMKTRTADVHYSVQRHRPLIIMCKVMIVHDQWQR